jgi:hypothetical protein
MKKLMNRNIIGLLIVIFVAVGGIWFFTRGGSAEGGVQNSVIPRGEMVGGTFVFLDDTRVHRDDFLIYRVIGRTDGGYLVAVTDAGEPSLNLGTNPIMLARECLTEFGEFFAEPPTEWEAHIMTAVDEQGRLFVLGISRAEYQWNAPLQNLNLFVYSSAGELEAVHSWASLPANFLPRLPSMERTATYAVGDVLVHVAASPGREVPMIVMFSQTTGEVLYLYEQQSSGFVEEPLLGGTVGGGYLYVLFRQGIRYAVRKIEIPTGNIVWEQSWHSITGDIEQIVFCNATERLYLFNPSYIFAYDGEGVFLLRDLTSSWLRAHQTVAMARPVSMFAFEDGRLHMAFHYSDSTDGIGGRFANFSEWLFVPYFDESAERRLAERIAEWAEIPVLRYFTINPFFGTFSFQHDLLRFAEERGVFVEFSYLQGFAYVRDGLTEYTEALNTAIFADTANWDIIDVPGSTAPNSEFALRAFAERGMLVDLLPHLGTGVLEDSETYFTNLFRALKTGDGIYHLPLNISVPFLAVQSEYLDNDFLEYLAYRSQSWTWEEFYQIAHYVEQKTGMPPISCDSFFEWLRPFFVQNAFSNVPPFFLFDEELLLSIGSGEGLEYFSQAMGLYGSLVSPQLNLTDSLGIFTFACIRHLPMLEAPLILPLPSMRGEYIFFTPFTSHAVLTTGANPQLAAEFLAEHLYTSVRQHGRNHPRNVLSMLRQADSPVPAWLPQHSFDEYETVVNRVNTFVNLPGSIRLSIYDAVVQYVHGALSRDAAVQRVADIMWIFVNE